MAVEHNGRLLLGHRAGAPGGLASVLAGFVSPGESAEEAVVREVYEESTIVAYEPAYVTSQPWPFPASLMLGFHARSDGGDRVSADGELARSARSRSTTYAGPSASGIPICGCRRRCQSLGS